ncbi:MAG TPA: hypothetical protein VMD02_05220 [Candidatus Omnitrophota bacterium]|nr:hypothetical protein [Candidatus Omnitrophota bacterium]
MKRRSLAAIILISVLAAPVLGLYRFDFPPDLIGSKFYAETRLKKDGSFFGRSTTTFEKVNGKGGEHLVVNGKAEGTLNGKAFDSETVRDFILENGRITSSSIKGKTVVSGEVSSEYSMDFDWQKMSAAVDFFDHQKNQHISKTVPIGPDLVAVQELDLYLCSLPARNARDVKLKALLPNGQTFGFIFKLAERPETLTIDGGQMVCRKIELKPDLGLISVFIPSVYYWVKDEPPYLLVRFSGMIGGPGSPDVIQDIKQLK